MLGIKWLHINYIEYLALNLNIMFWPTSTISVKIFILPYKPFYVQILMNTHNNMITKYFPTVLPRPQNIAQLFYNNWAYNLRLLSCFLMFYNARYALCTITVLHMTCVYLHLVPKSCIYLLCPFYGIHACPNLYGHWFSSIFFRLFSRSRLQ